MECHCFFRIVHDKMADGQTALEKRYGKTFDTKNAAGDAQYEEPPVLPRGSVALVQENITILAAQWCDHKSTPKKVGTRSVGSPTSIFTTDLGTLQQWRSIQPAYRLELQRLQHRIHHQWDGARCSRAPVSGRPAEFGIRSITLDMDALDRGCSAETAMGYLRPQPYSLRNPAGRKPQSELQPPGEASQEGTHLTLRLRCRAAFCCLSAFHWELLESEEASRGPPTPATLAAKDHAQ